MNRCETCGGDPRRGSTEEWTPAGYRAKPTPHADGDRHQRHALLTRKAAEGMVLLPGTYGYRVWPRTLGATVTETFLDLARDDGQQVWSCEWTSLGGLVPGAGVHTTWSTVEGCELTAEELKAKHRSLIPPDGPTTPSQYLYCAQELRAYVAAVEQVRRGLPWWAAVRTTDVWRRLPRWSVS